MNTSTARYFRLRDDMLIPGRWVLAQPEVDECGRKLSPWLFDRSEPVALDGLPIISVSLPGIALDFSETTLATPVVSSRVVTILEHLGVQDEAQLVPARVEGCPEPYFILNTIKSIRCIDDARCEEVVYWLPEDNRPDMEGQYRNVVGMKIDPDRAGGANIFRPWGWPVALIVSERVKNAMEAAGITGMEFSEV